MAQAEHPYAESWTHLNYRIIECQSCGFKHIDPIPAQAEVERFYREEYHVAVKKFPYDRITPESIAYHEEWLKSYPPYRETYAKVMELKKTDSLKMIDIGCGNNILIRFFQNQGWRTIAVEPSAAARDYLQKYGLEVVAGTAESIATIGLGDCSFVNLQFVLEHLRNPLEVLRKMYDLLEPGGIIRVCVPNDFSPGQMAYCEHFNEQLRWVCLPDHINYFTFDSLSALLAKAGFQEVYRTANFPLEFLLLGGVNYYAGPEEQQKVNPFVTNFEAAFSATGRSDRLQQFYEHLAQLGFGRSIFMYAIKE